MSVAALLVASTLAAALSWQDPQAVVATPLVLTVTYEGGRAVPYVVTTRPSGSWTPMFPKIDEWRRLLRTMSRRDPRLPRSRLRFCAD